MRQVHPVLIRRKNGWASRTKTNVGPEADRIESWHVPNARTRGGIVAREVSLEAVTPKWGTSLRAPEGEELVEQSPSRRPKWLCR